MLEGKRELRRIKLFSSRQFLLPGSVKVNYPVKIRLSDAQNSRKVLLQGNDNSP